MSLRPAVRDAVSTLTALGVVTLAMLACKGGKTDSSTETTSASATPSAATSATSALAPSASAAASAVPDASKPKPKAVAGCPDGWTRTTKGICVDWCETDEHCFDGKTCQDSDHVDPDLGKIKTCQKVAVKAPAGAADTTAPADGKCPAGYALLAGPKTASGKPICHKTCAVDMDCDKSMPRCRAVGGVKVCAPVGSLATDD